MCCQEPKLFSAETNVNELPDWILKRLQELDWNQNRLSRESGVSHGQISKIINGLQLPSPEVAMQLGRALGVSAETILKMAGRLKGREKLLPLVDELITLTEGENEHTIRQWIAAIRAMKGARVQSRFNEPQPEERDFFDWFIERFGEQIEPEALAEYKREVARFREHKRTEKKGGDTGPLVASG
jgi:transcriptional regulator with XRE-family HTH domain